MIKVQIVQTVDPSEFIKQVQTHLNDGYTMEFCSTNILPVELQSLTEWSAVLVKDDGTISVPSTGKKTASKIIKNHKNGTTNKPND